MPCPFHLIWQHVEWLKSRATTHDLEIQGLTLAISDECNPIMKDAMVVTFEALAAARGDPSQATRVFEGTEDTRLERRAHKH